jgi:uncharacterized membrane protein YphA (DoxX/SURF4 family)
MSSHACGVVAALATAVVFLVSGVAKVAAPGEWRSQSAGMGVPWPVARMVPFVELILGALLLVRWPWPAVAWCAVALLVAFTVLIIVRLGQGQHPPCACFGAWSSKPIGPGHVARNAVFIAVAVVAAVL